MHFKNFDVHQTIRVYHFFIQTTIRIGELNYINIANNLFTSCLCLRSTYPKQYCIVWNKVVWCSCMFLGLQELFYTLTAPTVFDFLFCCIYHCHYQKALWTRRPLVSSSESLARYTHMLMFPCMVNPVTRTFIYRSLLVQQLCPKSLNRATCYQCSGYTGCTVEQKSKHTAVNHAVSLGKSSSSHTSWESDLKLKKNEGNKEKNESKTQI